MAKRIITDESVEAAKKYWEDTWEEKTSFEAIQTLLDFLCVKEEVGRGILSPGLYELKQPTEFERLPYELKKVANHPKPFGPSSRLKASNGDIWQVCKDTSDNTFIVVDVINSKIINLMHKEWRKTWWLDLNELHQALIAAGATVLEEEEIER